MPRIMLKPWQPEGEGEGGDVNRPEEWKSEKFRCIVTYRMEVIGIDQTYSTLHDRVTLASSDPQD
jgi:hypothetical protein